MSLTPGRWRKSTFSDGGEGDTRVELAASPTPASPAP
ncbi:DUF397 domain-containing protein [Streptomyces scabiei]|nr:DUF397 domain-containing protein [Streptomyces scabiei]